jgi:hypothetical protein
MLHNIDWKLSINPEEIKVRVKENFHIHSEMETMKDLKRLAFIFI